MDPLGPDLGHHHHGEAVGIRRFQRIEIARRQMATAELHELLSVLAPWRCMGYPWLTTVDEVDNDVGVFDW